MKRLGAAMLFLVCAIGAARGQQFDPKYQDWLNRNLAAVENTIGELRKMYRPHLSAEEQAMMDSIIVSIRPADWDILDAYAIAPPDVSQRTIVLSAGAIMVYDFADRAAADAVALNDTNPFGDYMTALADQVEATIKATAVGQRVPAMPGYCEWRKHTPAECFSLRAQPQYDNNFGLIKLSSIGLLFAHELGHHVKKHELQPNRPRIEKETEADDFAIRLMIRSDLNPVGGIGLFSMMAALEGAPPNRPQDRNRHPYGFCRVVKAYNLGYAELLKDEGFIAYVKQRGTLQMVKDQLAQINSLADQNTKCD
jgi:hypothetical protein